jgi:hypothetical protein
MPPVQLMSPGQTQAAWTWLLGGLPQRSAIGQDLSYDDFAAWQDAVGRLLHPEPTVLANITSLYAMSTFCDARALKDLVNGINSPAVMVPTPLDQTLRDLYAKEARFRNSLAEHLGFWLPIAIRKKAAPGAVIAGSKPHVLPEDTGPDGIVLDCGSLLGDLVSIKSCLTSPRSMIASATFRSRGTPRTKKPPLLDEFQLYDKRNRGFTKVTDLALQVANAAHLNINQQATNALLATFTYHAFVVASHLHAAPALFDGFARISNVASRRFATYLGASDWRAFAKRARTKYRGSLTGAGIDVRP